MSWLVVEKRFDEFGIEIEIEIDVGFQSRC